MRGRGLPGRCIAIGVAALALAACGTTATQIASTGSPPVELNLATANNMMHTPVFVGVEKGFFLKHGLKVKPQVLSTGAEISKALESGSVQFGSGAISGVAPARQAGLNTVMFVPYMGDATTAYSDNSLAVVARTDSGIKSGDWSSFVGKKVGLVKGGTGDEFLTRWLTNNGVDPKKVTYLNVQPGDQLAAIQGRNVDAIATWEPYQTLILDQLGGGGLLIQRGGGILGYILGLVTTEEYARAHPDQVQHMTDAIVETAAWIRSHSAEAAAVDTHWIPGLDTRVATDAIKHLNFDPRVSSCSVRAFAESTQLLLEQKKLRQNIPAGQQIIGTYVVKTQQAHPEWFKDLKPVPAAAC